MILDSLGVSSVTVKVLTRGRRRQESLNQKNGRSHRERFEDVIPLALNMEEETTSQRMQVASRSWKNQGTFSWNLQKEDSPIHNLF